MQLWACHIIWLKSAPPSLCSFLCVCEHCNNSNKTMQTKIGIYVHEKFYLFYGNNKAVLKTKLGIGSLDWFSKFVFICVRFEVSHHSRRWHFFSLGVAYLLAPFIVFVVEVYFLSLLTIIFYWHMHFLTALHESHGNNSSYEIC